MCRDLGRSSSPALLQSTVKVFFCPMKALDRPAPLETTLLPSDENFGNEPNAPPTAEDLLTVSTRTDDVSCKLCPAVRRGPAETIGRADRRRCDRLRTRRDRERHRH